MPFPLLPLPEWFLQWQGTEGINNLILFSFIAVVISAVGIFSGLLGMAESRSGQWFDRNEFRSQRKFFLISSASLIAFWTVGPFIFIGGFIAVLVILGLALITLSVNAFKNQRRYSKKEPVEPATEWQD